MGYPEEESRVVSEAARGDMNLAIHYFDVGLPESPPAGAPPAQSTPESHPAAAAITGPATATSAETLQSFRQHPQFDLLRRTVQQDPARLPDILNIIGQQQPALLSAIHSNEATFLAMMNEPISASPPAAPAQAARAAQPGDPAAMIGMLARLPEEHRAQFAESIGMSPQQLAQFMQMVSSMPPDALANLLNQGGMGGLGGAPGGHPPNTVTLTPDEMAAVQRLEELGGGRFSRQQAAEAYLSCERNEMMAAQLLLDGGWGDEDDYGGGNDDMYN